MRPPGLGWLADIPFCAWRHGLPNRIRHRTYGTMRLAPTRSTNASLLLSVPSSWPPCSSRRRCQRWRLRHRSATPSGAVDSGDAARLLDEEGRTDEAITWLQARAKAAGPVTLREAARLLLGAGRTGEAITYFQRAAEADSLDTLWQAIHLLYKARQTNEAIIWFAGPCTGR